MFGLTRLWLHRTKVPEVVFSEGVFPNLNEIYIYSCVNVELVNLKTLRSLREASVTECPKLKRIQGLAQLTKLDILKVVGPNEIVSLEGVEHCILLGWFNVFLCPKL